MRPIEITIPLKRWPLGKGVTAITLWPFILYREGRRTTSLEAHEHYHWHQALRWGVIPWYLAYLVLLVACRTGKRNHPMERRAYEIEDAMRVDW